MATTAQRDHLDLAGTIEKPAAKRNVAWDEAIRRTRTASAASPPVRALTVTNVHVGIRPATEPRGGGADDRTSWPRRRC